mmetsp:Transcript_63713/g.180969  ORF Transcript_63713/g.180969 Transcript_63713/m.180969 type:complete len:365 (+) Transcript_63713:1370-2464(+)
MTAREGGRSARGADAGNGGGGVWLTTARSASSALHVGWWACAREGPTGSNAVAVAAARWAAAAAPASAAAAAAAASSSSTMESSAGISTGSRAYRALSLLPPSAPLDLMSASLAWPQSMLEAVCGPRRKAANVAESMSPVGSDTTIAPAGSVLSWATSAGRTPSSARPCGISSARSTAAVVGSSAEAVAAATAAAAAALDAADSCIPALPGQRAYAGPAACGMRSSAGTRHAASTPAVARQAWATDSSPEPVPSACSDLAWASGGSLAMSSRGSYECDLAPCASCACDPSITSPEACALPTSEASTQSSRTETSRGARAGAASLAGTLDSTAASNSAGTHDPAVTTLSKSNVVPAVTCCWRLGL